MKNQKNLIPSKKSSRLIVKNLPPSLDEKSLKYIFEKHGEITDCKIMFKNQKNRRIAFIGFRNQDDASDAKQQLNSSFIQNYKIIVDYSSLKQQGQQIEQKNDKNQEYESKRLFIKNLPYDIEENEIESLFKKYGEITELKLLRKQGRGIGSGFISYDDQNAAILALDKLNNKIFQGRILHVNRCRLGGPKNNNEEIKEKMIQEQKSSFKKVQKGRIFQRLKDSQSWNSLFLNPNTVIELMAQKLNMNKKELLDNEIDNPAQVQTMIEHEIIEEVKQFFINNNMNLKSFDKSPEETERSNKVLLVKNLSFDSKKQKLQELFQNYGNLQQVLMPLNKALAVVEFKTIEDAKNCFEILQGYLFNKQPLFLEWAPSDLIISQNQTTSDILKKKELKEDEEYDKSNTIFVKNLNFKSTEQDLQEFIENKNIKGIKSVKIVQINGKSQGFGFVEFSNEDQAMEMLKRIQNQMFDQHILQLSISKKKQSQNQEIKQSKQKESTKLILKNIPFQATKQELKDLLQNLIDIKKLRFPKKLDNTPKGYAFIEMKTIEESIKAKDILKNLHFYGRKIVVDFANEQLIFKNKIQQMICLKDLIKNKLQSLGSSNIQKEESMNFNIILNLKNDNTAKIIGEFLCQSIEYLRSENEDILTSIQRLEKNDLNFFIKIMKENFHLYDFDFNIK